MKFINGYLFGIDKSLDEPKYKELKEGDALNYMKVLIDEILNNPNKKQYKIRDENTQVISIILNSIKMGYQRKMHILLQIDYLLRNKNNKIWLID